MGDAMTMRTPPELRCVGAGTRQSCLMSQVRLGGPFQMAGSSWIFLVHVVWFQVLADFKHQTPSFKSFHLIYELVTYGSGCRDQIVVHLEEKRKFHRSTECHVLAAMRLHDFHVEVQGSTTIFLQMQINALLHGRALGSTMLETTAAR